jgi:hypothetical protein
MLRITDKLEDKEILVTRGAFENLYKGLGYKIVGEKKETTVEKKEEKLPEPVVSEPTVKEEPKEEKNDDLFDDIMSKKSYRRKK